MELQFYHISDLCRLIAKILEARPDTHIFNAGNPETISVKEWVAACYDVLGKKPDFICVSDDIPQRSYFPFYDYEYRLDVEQMMNTAPEITPLKTGLKQAYDWWKNNREAVVRKPLLNYIAEHLASE